MADSRPQEVTAVKGRDRFFHGCEGGNAADGACAGGAGSPETRNSNLQRHEGAIAMSQRLGGCAQWMRGEVRVNDVKAGAPRRSGGPGSRRAWGNETTSASPEASASGQTVVRRPQARSMQNCRAAMAVSSSAGLSHEHQNRVILPKAV